MSKSDSKRTEPLKRKKPLKKGEIATPKEALERLKNGYQRFLDRNPANVNL